MTFASRTEPLRWHDGYDFPAARDGEVIRESIKTGMPQPSEYLVFNTRRPVFSDIRVRQALTLLFDFEWINRNYFFGLYTRIRPASLPGLNYRPMTRSADDRERELLETVRGADLPRTFSMAATACPSATLRAVTASRFAPR